MTYNVELHIGCMTMSVTPAKDLEDAKRIKAHLEKEWSDPVITDGPGLEVKITREDENEKKVMC